LIACPFLCPTELAENGGHGAAGKGADVRGRPLRVGHQRDRPPRVAPPVPPARRPQRQQDARARAPEARRQVRAAARAGGRAARQAQGLRVGERQSAAAERVLSGLLQGQGGAGAGARQADRRVQVQVQEGERGAAALGGEEQLQAV